MLSISFLLVYSAGTNAIVGVMWKSVKEQIESYVTEERRIAFVSVEEAYIDESYVRTPLQPFLKGQRAGRCCAAVSRGRGPDLWKTV